MKRRIALAVLCAVIVIGCGALQTRGTMPPSGVDGEIDPSSVPDFVAVAGDAGVVGYVPKAAILEPTGDDAMPVVGEDLRTVVGHLVRGKGFVPLGVDPATVPHRPVEQGPSVGPAGGPGRVVYVRNLGPGEIWLAVNQADEPGAAGFQGGMAVSCGLDLARPLAVWVSEPANLMVARLPAGSAVAWIDRAGDGTVTVGEGVPEWWAEGVAC